jgi:hypothetical protein
MRREKGYFDTLGAVMKFLRDKTKLEALKGKK